MCTVGVSQHEVVHSWLRASARSGLPVLPSGLLLCSKTDPIRSVAVRSRSLPPTQGRPLGEGGGRESM